MQSQSGARSALVIGAGLAGLTAAYRLKQAGFAVTVLEKRNRVGGRVKTERRDGFVIDVGPDAMSAGYTNYQALAKELGLADRFVASSPVIGVVRGGRVHDIDPRRKLSALLAPSMSSGAKLRFVKGLWSIRHLFSGVSSSKLVESADLDDERDTAHSFGARVFGTEATEYLIDPLMRLTVGSGARQASTLGVLGGMVDWAVPLINIKGGLDVLPNELVRHFDVVTGASVELVTEQDDCVEVRYRDADGRARTWTGSTCVIAATYDVAERIYPKLMEHSPQYGRSLRYVTQVSISLAYARVPATQAYVVLVPTVENADISLMFLQHNKAPDRVPPGHGLITLYTDTIATPRYMDLPDAAIETWARAQTERLFPELNGHFEFATITRWPIVGYLAVPGFWRRTRELLRALPETARIQIAGDLFGAGSMEAAVTWGERAAERIIRHWS